MVQMASLVVLFKFGVTTERDIMKDLNGHIEEGRIDRREAPCYVVVKKESCSVTNPTPLPITTI